VVSSVVAVEATSARACGGSPSVRSSASTMRAAVSTRLWSARVRMVDEDHAHLGARPSLLRADGVVHGPTTFGLPRLT